MTNKQVNLIKKITSESVPYYDKDNKSYGERFGTLFEMNGCIYLYNAMGSFMIKFKDSEDIKYLKENFEIKTDKDVPKTVTDDTWFLGYNCYTDKPYTFSYFKEFVRDIKDLNGKCVDFLDTEINYNIIVNYDLLTKLYDLTRGKFTIGYLDCNAPLHFENNKYEAILMPVYVSWISNR